MMIDQNYSFVAYIDESGCDGLNKDGTKNGASQWFVLSALIVRKSLDPELPRTRDDILSKISRQRKILHMKELKKEDHKLFVAKSVSEIPSRCISILSNKHSIINATRKDLFDQKNTYYNYMARYLIERISGCCSQLRSIVPEGNGKVKIIFSRRGGMSYTDFQAYLNKLKEEDLRTPIPAHIPKINWNIIDIDLIDAIPHSKRAGLQLVDTVAYSFFKAVEKNDLNMVNASYARFFEKNIYKVNQQSLNYGLTIIKSNVLPEDEKPKDLYEIYKK
ncbi:MAG: DUF3800 domain-containing protein [Alphaproteobacteria bacterium]|nr:DUF3800 domain-containing protein [Alphaproteobacteria bacterium]